MKRLLALVLALTALASSSQAQVVYDNFNVSDGYNPVNGWIVANGPPFGQIEQAMRFEATGDGSLIQAQLALTMVDYSNFVGVAGTADMVVSVYSDVGGQPGTMLDTTSFTANLEANGTNNPLPVVIDAHFLGGAVLNDSVSYWLTVGTTTQFSTEVVIWNLNTTGVTGTTADRSAGGQWNLHNGQILSAFRVMVGDGTVGQNYCSTNPNSTGFPAIIAASGSASIAANSFTLTAEPVPAQPGIFYYGTSSLNLAFGNGFRCVGGTVVRLNPPGPPSNGVATRNVDLIGAGLTPGTVYFQYWHRDPLGGGAFFNLSDGLEVDLVP